MSAIPVIPVTALLERRADRDVMAGASGSGFLTLSDVDATLGLEEPRKAMLDFFRAGPDAKARTLRNKYDSTRPNVYRGYFPAEPEKGALLEGFDIGPDVMDPRRAGDGGDPLTEPTPRPGLPDWNEAVAEYYAAMCRVGDALTRALLRGLNADEALADQLFSGTISSLRLLRYPETPEAYFPPERQVSLASGETRWIMTKPHTDSGFVTLLWQDATGGLQAQGPDEGWIDVPPARGGLVVNFGQMLADWSSGRIKATPHRVLGGGAERFSVPFFYEPAVDAVIEPLFRGESGADSFVYGDFLWERMVNFPNFHGVVRCPAATAGKS